MFAKYKVSKSLAISLFAHFILVLVLYVLPTTYHKAVETKVDVVFLNLESKPLKRRSAPKRAAIQPFRESNIQAGRATADVAVTQMRVSGESVIYTDAQIRSGGDADVLAATPGIGSSKGAFSSSIGERQMRAYSQPIEMKQVTTRGGKSKSRLVLFIERMEGPQNIIYCIDLSSSMNALGIGSFRIVINLIQHSLRTLEAQDRFNIFTFGARTIFYKPEMMPVTENNVEQAIKFLTQLSPGNIPSNFETDLFTALEQAKRVNSSIIVLFSDGLPTTEAPGMKNIMNNIGSSGKLFAMTINMDETYPGAVLMRKLAEKNEGEFWLVEE
ncbi:VWA domain-containing protein [Candidatus Poribacteria bacterium]|nr:VWA domain-containing protein [Candidatus Poribacteria bacterium]